VIGDDRPAVVVHDPGLAVSDTDLVLLRPVHELPSSQRDAVGQWLTTHSIDPARVAVGAPVTRHEDTWSVSWREVGEDGLVVHHLYPAVRSGDLWPAPFPPLDGLTRGPVSP
jgi:hypothetical protein